MRGHKINNESTLCFLGHSPGKVGCPIHAAAKVLKLWLLCLPPCPLSSSEPRCICITWEQQRTHRPPCGATATSPLRRRGRPSTSVLLEILFFLTSLWRLLQEWAWCVKTVMTSLTPATRYTESSSCKWRDQQPWNTQTYFDVYYCAGVCSASLPFAYGKLKRMDQMLPGCYIFGVNYNSNPWLETTWLLAIGIQHDGLIFLCWPNTARAVLLVLWDINCTPTGQNNTAKAITPLVIETPRNLLLRLNPSHIIWAM